MEQYASDDHHTKMRSVLSICCLPKISSSSSTSTGSQIATLRRSLTWTNVETWTAIFYTVDGKNARLITGNSCPHPVQCDISPHRHSQLSDLSIRLYSTTSLKSISLKWWLSKTIWPICFSPNWLYHCSAHHFAPIWLFSSHCPGFFQKKPFDTVRHSTLLSKLPWKLYEHTVWLHDVTKAALVSQLTYAAPAWSVCSENFTSTRYGWFFTPRCHYVTKAALVSQLTYAAPAWSGYLSETDTNRLQSVIKKAKRFGYLSSSFCNFDELYARA